MFQRKFIFFPAQGQVGDPRSLGIEAERIALPISDSITLCAWWAAGGKSPYTLLWCHGNAGNISHRSEEFRKFLEAGFNVVLFDYRGYGESTGVPSMEDLCADTLALYDFLRAQGVEGSRIVPYGRSLGSGFAAYLANRREVAGLILAQPLTSTLEMGKRSFPFLPVSWLLQENLDNKAELAEYSGPLLILHGDCDDVVPFAMGKSLYDLSPSPRKEFVALRGCDHNNLGVTHGGQLIESIHRFLCGLDLTEAPPR